MKAKLTTHFFFNNSSLCAGTIVDSKDYPELPQWVRNGSAEELEPAIETAMLKPVSEKATLKRVKK